MRSTSRLILAAAPTDWRAAASLGLPLAHVAYRVGAGPRLFRANIPVALRGGMMVLDDAGCDGRGDAAPFCREVLRECSARGFEGVICAFRHRNLSLLSKIVAGLGELFQKRGWPLYVTEAYADCSAWAGVLVSSALSGGSLQLRLSEAQERDGRERVVLLVERVCRDFFLPSPTGQGQALAPEELRLRMEELSPAVFFSGELCAHYFTYMSPQSGAHFVLFDDAGSIRKKLQVARGLGIDRAVLSYAQTADLLPELLRQG